MAVGRYQSTALNLVLNGCLKLLSAVEDTGNGVSDHPCRVAGGLGRPPDSTGSVGEVSVLSKGKTSRQVAGVPSAATVGSHQ